ncbi:centrosomal protein of 97 kDa isoform X2 [Denticeps clupeoides]|uniref:centrosomal protein of 97 kDa isoform X2 n=1 Tax=Denticeps clupeoides TaxID=299321 RepID=UPI0010A3B510|nr:centrosomal protein of 97 kDa isoform X2 [Denticeps clupeoides]
MAATESASEPGPAMQAAKTEGSVVDLSGQGLNKLEPISICHSDIDTLILDHNQIIKLEHLEKNERLKQLSVAGNRLVRMMGVSRLTDLRVLNLPNNSIGYIEGLKDLVHLQWLNLAGNNIKVMDQLSSCLVLQHLDMSDNNISHPGDLSKLTALKTLLLHGNIITSLRSIPVHLPPSLTVLSLAENEIRDLNEVSYLTPLHKLEQLSVMNNPCVMATPTLPGFDYRPYILSWCLNLKVLDGYMVSQKEGLKAEWLYSQGRGRSYRPGQHMQLAQYLASVCPLTGTSALQSEEDAKLERILSKQRQHQRQLLQTGNRLFCGPARPTELSVEHHRPEPSERAKHPELPTPPKPAVLPSEPVVQVNSWIGKDASFVPVARSPRSPVGSETSSLRLDDVQTDEEKLHGSLPLETSYVPLNSTSHSKPCSDDSDEEPDEPDSLAPPRPRAPECPVTPSSPPSTVTEGRPSPAPTPDIPMPQPSMFSHPQLNMECSELAIVVPTPGAEKPPMSHTKAAVRIQAWWRGHWVRQSHPVCREVRCEIRLRRIQDHVVFLTNELQRVQKQHEEERLQRMVQEEAVKFLWKQMQCMLEWQSSVSEQLKSVFSVPAASRDVRAPVQTELSLPESGFHSPGKRQRVMDDSLSSTAITGSPGATVQGHGTDEDSQDCSLLEQYLNSVQKREEEETEDRTATPLSPAQLASPHTPKSGSEEDSEKQGPLLEAEG